jgi:hypothetical protein
MTTRQIALQVMAVRGLNTDDAALVLTITAAPVHRSAITGTRAISSSPCARTRGGVLPEGDQVFETQPAT